ncbi:MAG TPA: hypothetical protein PKK43_09940 [Spirochaetota bacterium]|nr:hypothetical protein [Spirochaetota bacterium]
MNNVISDHPRISISIAATLAIIVCTITLRQTLFNSFFSYQILSERRFIAAPSHQSGRSTGYDTTEDGMIDDSLRETADTLSFTVQRCSRDPEELRLSHKTNCIGYARFFCAEFNRRTATQGQSDRYRAAPFIGKIRFGGFDLHSLFPSPFFKDHDFVIVFDRQNGNRTAVDPSLYDYKGISRVRLN